MEIERYFGIRFKDSCPLDSESKLQLAKQLFINPNVTAAEARKIIENIKMQREVQELIDNLQFEYPLTNIDDIRKELDKKVFGKLRRWIRIFSFPTAPELYLLASTMKVHSEVLYAISLDVLYSDGLAAYKVIDFIENFGFMPGNQANIDHYLDWYNFKKGVNNQNPLEHEPSKVEECPF